MVWVAVSLLEILYSFVNISRKTWRSSGKKLIFTNSCSLLLFLIDLRSSFTFRSFSLMKRNYQTRNNCFSYLIFLFYLWEYLRFEFFLLKDHFQTVIIYLRFQYLPSLWQNWQKCFYERFPVSQQSIYSKTYSGIIH